MFKVKFYIKEQDRWIMNLMKFNSYAEAYKYGYHNYSKFYRWQIVKI